MSQVPTRSSTSSTSSMQEERCWGNGGTSFDSHQNSMRQRASSMTSAFSRPHHNASISLSSYSSPSSRRYSSASDISESGSTAGEGGDVRNSYYQVCLLHKSDRNSPLKCLSSPSMNFLNLFSKHVILSTENERKK